MHPYHVVGQNRTPVIMAQVMLEPGVHDDVMSLDFIEGPILVDVSTVYTLHFSVNS